MLDRKINASAKVTGDLGQQLLIQLVIVPL